MTKLEQASQKINEILKEKTQGWYFASPGQRAIKWFKCYYIQKIFGEEAGYSISRTDARFALMAYDIDLDAMLIEAGL